MSLALYFRTLKWEGLKRSGWIKVGKHRSELDEHPPILLRLLDIFYAPEVRQLECRDDAVHSRRDLEKEEIGEIERYLEKLDGEWTASVKTANRRA